MRVGIILEPYGESAPAGLARASFEITRALIERYQDVEFVVYTKKPFSGPDFVSTNWKSHQLNSRTVLGASILTNDGIDLLLSLTPILPLRFPPVPSIVVALDFAYLSFARGLLGHVRARLLKLVHQWSFYRATHIIAISEYTRIELLKRFRVNPKKVTVIYEGFTPTVRQVSGSLDDKHTLLSISVIKERKNTLGIVEGFTCFKRRNPKSEISLVLVGKGNGSYLQQVVNRIGENGIVDNVRLTGFVPDTDIPSYYEDALAFIYPSITEGFGMPILESMHAGVPVITSRGGATEEIAGDAALLVNPHNPEEIAKAIETVLQSPATRACLVEKGIRRSYDFSWSATADEYFNIIKRLYGRY
jgi:glycosyltransferase involved in cell wall biosynthesis